MEKEASDQYRDKVKKIAILGPESTGKTSLAKNLAAHFGTVWLPEYARHYVENLGRKYVYEDVLHIARQQLILEEEYIQKADTFLFLDTELIITKIWLQEVFHDVPEWLNEAIKKERIDLYFLCYPDLKWEYDEVRENPNKRFYLYNLYLKELRRIGANFFIVKGYGPSRMDAALEQVKENFHLP